MKTKVVLIGGAGFIGHNIAIRLKKDNFEVFVVDGLNVNNLLTSSKFGTNRKSKSEWYSLNNV